MGYTLLVPSRKFNTLYSIPSWMEVVLETVVFQASTISTYHNHFCDRSDILDTNMGFEQVKNQHLVNVSVE